MDFVDIRNALDDDALQHDGDADDHGHADGNLHWLGDELGRPCSNLHPF